MARALDRHTDVVYQAESITHRLRTNRLIHELFEAQAERTPNAVALLHGQRKLTYAELNRSANRLAHHLVGCGIGADQVVGICVERSPEMVIGLLAILKAGGAYLPLDPNYPAERLQQMLEDAAPGVVLTHSELTGMLPQTAAQIMVLDKLLPRLEGQAEANLPASDLDLQPQHLVYVIYTSGSTGRPKGTGMSHGSMVNLMQWHRSALGEAEGRRVLQFAALSFDVAFQETFSTLCTGGTLVLLDEWVRRDARALLELLRSAAVERVFLPPLMLQSLAESFQTTQVLPDRLQDVITAGEALRISPQIRHLFEGLPGCRLHNHYGPTETHVVTALTLSGLVDTWPTLPSIGRPIANTQIYILDAQGEPVPVGVEGEIYIGGAGVARGYLNRPDLTQQRFVRDPFSEGATYTSHGEGREAEARSDGERAGRAQPDVQARMYRTGDLGRWSEEGTIEYLGRNDHQVKIRGYRIELGEIEAQLLSCEGVKEAVVVAREDAPGQKQLVGYLTWREGPQLSAEGLRTQLKERLPEYMVPSAFVTLPVLPLTPNGKLDRRSLPAPDLEAYAKREYEAPVGEVEEILAGIWRELLRIERVGRQDNFFELGGHSLYAVRLVDRIEQQFGKRLPIIAIFQKPTLQELAAAVGPGHREPADALEIEDGVI